MDVMTVKRQIKDRHLDNFYIFTGEETKAQDIYIAKISEVTSKEIQRVDTVADIYKKQRSLIAKPKCYVCRDDADFMKAEKAWDSLITALGDNMLIFLLSNADKRTKFYKRFSDNIVEFHHMPNDVLTKYIRKEINLVPAWCDELIAVCESDYSRILFEVDKINRYSKINKVDANRALKELLSAGAIYTPPQDAIFDWCDSVLDNNCNRSYELLEHCKRIGEPSLRLILVLYNNAKKLLQVQSCDSRDVCKSTGLSQWDVKCASKHLNRWQTADLVYMLKLLQWVERAVKTGELEDAVAIDYVMINLF